MGAFDYLSLAIGSNASILDIPNLQATEHPLYGVEGWNRSAHFSVYSRVRIGDLTIIATPTFRLVHFLRQHFSYETGRSARRLEFVEKPRHCEKVAECF